MRIGGLNQMSKDSRIYEVKWIKTARYLCRECGIFASLDDFLNDEPCRSCNGTRNKKSIRAPPPLFPVRITSVCKRFRTYDNWTLDKIEKRRKLGFIVEVLER